MRAAELVVEYLHKAAVMDTALGGNMVKFKYKVGSTIKYRAFDGEVRTVVVEEKSDDIKNGRPGFDGTTKSGMDCWGYDDQIIGVVSY